MSEELKVPNFVQNRIDVKKHIALSLQFWLDSAREGKLNSFDTVPEDTVHILTNAGIFTGKIIIDDKNASAFSQLLGMAIDVSHSALADQENQDSIVVNNTSSLILESATFEPYNIPQNVHRYGSVQIFADQILGLTIGHRESK